MRVHELVRAIIGKVNPTVIGWVTKSKGYRVDGAGNQIPYYDDPQEIELQVQSAQGDDLKQDNFVNMQGERKIIYAKGQLYGVDRVRELGGDLLEFYGRKWEVVQRLEAWEGSDWCKVLAVAQTDKPYDDTEGIEQYDDRK